MKKTFARLCRWCGYFFLAALAACSAPPPDVRPQSDLPVFPPPPTVPRVAAGYVVQPDAVSYVAVDYAEIPSWRQGALGGSLKAFRQSCRKLADAPQWAQVCRVASQISEHHFVSRVFFEDYFTPWRISHNGNPAGTVTGYYEPAIRGSLTPTARARFPVYGIPDDFISVPVTAADRGKTLIYIRPTGKNRGVIAADGIPADLRQFPVTARSRAIKGRVENGRFVPYYTRAEINAGALNGKAPVLAYADDPVELFFMQVQGSGRLQTPDGRSIALAYADKNEHPYRSIGRYMADRGYLPLAQTDMQGIKDWLRANPHKLAEIMGANPSFVFFRRGSESAQGPVGSLGVPLTPEYSVAVDRHHIDLGAPVFVATTDPRNGMALNLLTVAQDTGSAITGGVRIDYFWGYGEEAGRNAGKMKYPGYVWLLLPNGVLPAYRP